MQYAPRVAGPGCRGPAAVHSPHAALRGAGARGNELAALDWPDVLAAMDPPRRPADEPPAPAAGPPAAPASGLEGAAAAARTVARRRRLNGLVPGVSGAALHHNPFHQPPTHTATTNTSNPPPTHKPSP